MHTPAVISFHGFEARPGTLTLVRDHIEKLDSRFTQITTIRVVVDAPPAHKRTGAPYDVRIEIGVPGTELVINRHPGSRDRKEEVQTAVHDAFDAAARRLERWQSRRRHRRPDQSA